MDALFQRIKESIPKMEGWCTPEKGCALAKAIVDTKAELSVELGVFGGRGIISMAMAHEAIGKGVAWGFDPWTKEAALEGENIAGNDEWWGKLDLEGIYRGFVDHILAHELMKTCYWARLKSQDAVKLFKDDSIDLLHADSNHSEKVSCDEVFRWSSKVKDGGYWFADDIDWPTTKKAQKMLRENGFKLIEDHKKWAIYRKI